MYRNVLQISKLLSCVHVARNALSVKAVAFIAHMQQCLTYCMCVRDMVRQKKITMEEGTLMRTLLFMPGGLELHIGVSQQSLLNLMG